MIERAIRLRYKIDRFCAKHQKSTKKSREEDDNDNLVRDDTLSLNDWDTLTQILKLLKPFKDVTARLEGNAKFDTYDRLWKCLFTMKLLIKRIKEY